MEDSNKKSSKISKQNFPLTMCEGQFNFIKVLGKGAQGEVCLY